MIPEWQARLIDETVELKDKINKLQDYMRTKKFYELDRPHKDLLYLQLQHMINYLQTLGKRLELLKLEIPFEEE